MQHFSLLLAGHTSSGTHCKNCCCSDIIVLSCQLDLVDSARDAQ